MSIMAEYTSAPDETRLPAILHELSTIPDQLIVLNHPFWLEEGIGESDRHDAVEGLLRESAECIHAFELNGTRPWGENRDTIRLADRHGRPVISGGDRHGCEPSACVNLTSASTFEEFADEVREGRSTVAFLPHYLEPMPTRLVQAVWDILRPYPEFPDRRLWTDRVFYQCEDGVDRRGPVPADADRLPEMGHSVRQ